MPRFRPRISLLSALLLITIVSMAIVIAQLWRAVGPLRAENRQLRTELGFLNIDDPTKACAIQLMTGESRTWKWRIYLPLGQKYTQAFYSGKLPSPMEYRGSDWYERVKDGSVGSGTTGTSDGGEFTLTAKLHKSGDQWIMETQASGGRDSGKNSITQPSGDWLSAADGISSGSNVSPRGQTVFEAGEPIMLLKALKPIVTKFPGGHSSRDPEGAADGFVLWIEQPPPPPP